MKRRGTRIPTSVINKNFSLKSKRSQITIFVIIAIVIIAGVILFFALTDTGRNLLRNITGQEIDFNSQVRNCIENNPEIKSEINLIMSQGGSLNPGNYFLYNDTKFSYLCYTNQYYKGCVMQNPNLLFNTENEIENSIRKSMGDDISGACGQLSAKSVERSA